MALRVEFDDDARCEFDDAVNWYAARNEGAALGLVSEVDAAIDAIVADPGRFLRTYAGCQMRRLKRYPYCVVYYRHNDIIRIVAVAHAKRRPGYWRSRL